MEANAPPRLAIPPSVRKSRARALSESSADSCMPEASGLSSGSTGLHILLPNGGRFDFQQSRALATLIVGVAHAREPERTTLNRALSKKESKVYIDCRQNCAGQTIVAPFSVRAHAGAPVSMPLRWSELSPKKNNERFTITNSRRRVRQLKTEPVRQLLETEPDLAASVARLDRLIKDDGTN